MIKKANEPLLLSIDNQKDSIYFYLVNDYLKKNKVKVNFAFTRFDGKVLNQSEISINSISNSSQKFHSISKSSLDIDTNQTYIAYQLKNDKNELIAENKFYFTKPKNLLITNAKINYDIIKNNSSYLLSLTTSNLKKNIFISIE